MGGSEVQGGDQRSLGPLGLQALMGSSQDALAFLLFCLFWSRFSCQIAILRVCLYCWLLSHPFWCSLGA